MPKEVIPDSCPAWPEDAGLFSYFETHLELRFENGHCLSVFDDWGYESLVVEYGD